MNDIAARQTPAAGRRFGEVAIALTGGIFIALAAFWAAPGVYSIDGLIYQAMVDAFTVDGSLFVTNGYAEYGAAALRDPLFRDSDGLLAPQYPGGWGIIAAPAYLVGGVRGVMLVNAIAAALSLPLIWVAARALFGDRQVATHAALIFGIATFAVEYAVGFWPHAITTFLVTAAVAAVATGWRGTPAEELRGALVAGLMLGIGVNIRVDAAFAAAPIAVWLLAVGRRPYRALGMLAAGLAPGLVAAAAINYVKFGVPSPVSYGTNKGATSFGFYATLAPVALAGALACLSLSLARVRAVLFRPAALALVAAAVLVLLLAAPGPREAALRIAKGVWILAVDFQAYPRPSRGLVEMPDGTIRMFGLVKKALLQSLPYAAAIIVLAPRLMRGPDRAAVAFCVVFIVLGIVPFAFGNWHGGKSNNMRYLLNLVPVLSTLAALALREISAQADARRLPGLAVLLAVISAASAWAAWRGYRFDFALQQTAPNAVVFAIAGFSLIFLVSGGAVRRLSAAALRSLFSIGLLLAVISAWGVDLQVTQRLRARNAELAQLTADLPADALVISPVPEAAGFRFNRPPALTAYIDFMTRDRDPGLAALVRRAFAEGRPVFVQGKPLSDRMMEWGMIGPAQPRYGIAPQLDLHQAAPPAATREGT